MLGLLVTRSPSRCRAQKLPGVVVFLHAVAKAQQGLDGQGWRHQCVRLQVPSRTAGSLSSVLPQHRKSRGGQCENVTGTIGRRA